jgi:hypothetical protein
MINTCSRERRRGKLSDAIVHLGIAKTGTTSLQTWLTSNQSYLRTQGITALSTLACHRLAVECVVDPLVCSRKDVLWIKDNESLAKLNENLSAIKKTTRASVPSFFRQNISRSRQRREWLSYLVDFL